MDYASKLDEIAAKAEQVKNMIGLTHQEGVTKEQYNAVLYIVSDYLIDIIKLAEGVNNETHRSRMDRTDINI